MRWASNILSSYEEIKNKKKLMSLLIMNSVGLYSINTYESVGILNDIVYINRNIENVGYGYSWDE